MGYKEDIIEHYGVQGMKWGVRKDVSTRTPTDAAIKRTTKRGIKTTGGKNQPASEDAKRTALTGQTAKKSGTHALSNKDLQDLVNRLNLEQNYERLKDSNPRQNRGKKFIKKILGQDQGKGSRMNPLDSRAADEVGAAFKKAGVGVKAARGLGSDIKKVKIKL